MKYHCECCNYSTDERQSWYNHKKSKKHFNNKSIKEINEKNKELQEQTQVKNSTEITMIKKDYEIELLKQKLKTLEQQLKEKDKQLEKMDNHIKYLQTENEFHKQLISSAGGLIEKSMNTFNYLLLNYAAAPHLNKLDDYSILSQNNDQLIKTLVFYYNKKKLPKYIGDFIIKNYKKDKPEQQSLWSSDAGRLNYIIKELIENKKQELDSKWVIDKKGVKMTKYIIEPLLEYIKSINLNYLKNCIDLEEIDETDKSSKKLKQSIAIGSINTSIINKELSNEINKYIAPYFFFDRTGTIKNK